MEGKEKSKKGGTIKKTVLGFLAVVVITGVFIVIFARQAGAIYARLLNTAGAISTYTGTTFLIILLLLLNCIPIAVLVLCMVWKNQEPKRATICKIIAIITGIIMVIIDELLIMGMLLLEKH